jgi:hypothetical protein
MVHPGSHSPIADAIRHLSAERSPACLLDAGGNFLFVNQAWGEGSPEIGAGPAEGPLVGTSWLDRIQGEEVRRVHAEFLFRALRPASGARPRPVTHVVERNTPTSAVLVQIRMEPVLADGGPVAVAITHTAVRERPIDQVYDPVDRPAGDYRGADGAITQCACCRRVRDPGQEDRWDLVASLVEQPASGTATGLCGMCRELHYGLPAAE